MDRTGTHSFSAASTSWLISGSSSLLSMSSDTEGQEQQVSSQPTRSSDLGGMLLTLDEQVAGGADSSRLVGGGAGETAAIFSKGLADQQLC